MLAPVRRFARALFLIAFFLAAPTASSLPAPTVTGILRDASGNPVPRATVALHAVSGAPDYSAETSPRGEFLFAGVAPGNYELQVTAIGITWKSPAPLLVRAAALTF